MKRFILCFFSFILFAGCGNKNSDVIKKLDKKIENMKSYHLLGNLEIKRGDDKYVYDVDSSYLDDNYYRVALTNTTNNHEQIILKNDTGVYVLNPTINKSYKFESDWPYNNSGVYLLQMIINDLKSDDNCSIKKIKDGYKIKSKVNYANNSNFLYQWVYLDNDLNIKKIEVYDKNNQVIIKMIVEKFEKNPKFDSNYFTLNANNENSEIKTSSSKIDDIIYPMYLPANTYLTNQEKISTKDGERVILNFDGDSSFMLVEETISVPDELETNMVYGEPDIILDTVGLITDYSVSWISNGVEYSIVSSNMDTEQMMAVASSINVLAVGK